MQCLVQSSNPEEIAERKNLVNLFRERWTAWIRDATTAENQARSRFNENVNGLNELSYLTTEAGNGKDPAACNTKLAAVPSYGFARPSNCLQTESALRFVALVTRKMTAERQAAAAYFNWFQALGQTSRQRLDLEQNLCDQLGGPPPS